MEWRKKIIFVFNGNFPFGGASANFARYFAVGLLLQNNEIEVILPSGNYYGNGIDKNKSKKGNIYGVPYKHLCFVMHPRNYFGKFIDNIFGLFLPVFYLIKKAVRNKVDIIIIYDTDFLKTLFIVFVKTILRKKLVVIIPEFYERPKTKFISYSLINYYSFYYGIRFVVKYADGFIVLSHYLNRYIMEKLKIKRDILVIPNLTDPKQFERENVHPFFENKVTIGYTGTPTRKDGILDLIKSFSILNRKYRNTHLLVIGDLTNGKTLIPELKEFADNLGVLENISFTGLVSYYRIPDLLHSCQILALTRPNGIFAEAGFPTKLSEYFACKKPVLITSVGDIPKYFENEKDVVLVEPEKIESIVAGFESLLNRKDLRERISQNGYNWMDQNTNYLNVSPKIDLFLERLIHNKKN